MDLDYRIEHIGDATLCFTFGDIIDADLNRYVLSIYQTLKKNKNWGDFNVLDLVPTYRSLAIHFKPGTFKMKEAEIFFSQQINQISSQKQDGDSLFKDVIIPVNYCGPDLLRVATLNQLSVEEVILIHTSVSYQVAMIGFRPHFPYLIGLDSRLVTARLDSPRKVIPAGSVAIGGAQTGVYPEPSPGGWNIIGESDPDLLKNVEPGDNIIFKAESK